MIICEEDKEFIEENIPCGNNIIKSGDTRELVRALIEWLTFYGYDVNMNVTEDARYASEIIDRLQSENPGDFDDEDFDEPEVSSPPDGIMEIYKNGR